MQNVTSQKEQKRVVFFSKKDLSWAYNLKNTELLLNDLNIEEKTEMNDLLELYNIKLYFDNSLFHPTWDDSTKQRFVQLIEKAWGKIRQYFLSVDNDKMISDLKFLESRYKKSYWYLINYLKVYESIGSETFSDILNKSSYQIRYILSNKEIVQYFNQEIKSYLLQFPQAAELLLSKFEQKHDFQEPDYYFPNSLTIVDKTSIIEKYIASDEPNPNYLKLIETSHSKELKLSNKIKFKAKKKNEEVSEKILNAHGQGWSMSVQVSIDNDQTEPVKSFYKNGTQEVSYSGSFLDSQLNNENLFSLFATLFEFIQKGLITLISKENELDVVESLFMQSKNEYPDGIAFRHKNYLALLQIEIFDYYLMKRNKSVEIITEAIITDVLNPALNGAKFRFNFPSSNASFLEKVRLLTPELEFLLKQFQAYVEDSEINLELLEFSSTSINLSSVGSLMNRKYIYSNNQIIETLKYYFFSDRSVLSYLESSQKEPTNFYELLRGTNAKLEDFNDFQIDTITQLTEQGYLYIDNNGFLKIKDSIYLFIVHELHSNNVICYWHYPEAIREKIDELVDMKILKVDNKLFTKDEISYYNFHLNKKEFINGFDLRNKYLHGTNSDLEKEHKNDYYLLLKLITLTILKVTEDIIIAKHLRSLES